MNKDKLQNFIHHTWDTSIIPALKTYIEIPCKSVAFDPDWQHHGYIDQAMELLSQWCQAQQISGMQLKIHRLPNRTPLLLIDMPGKLPETILLYGHMDKQPEMTGWDDDLAPWKAVLKNNRLYGRGGADDGYAVFAAMSAIKALQVQNIPHPRCVILIEASEESGSIDLPAYMQHLQQEIGTPSLIICLDSGADNYDQLWCTTSLRGLINAVLTVEILTEGVHSGAAGGIVPDSFRILRELLNRIENPTTGEILLKELHVDIPEERKLESQKTAEAIGDEVWKNYPWVADANPSVGWAKATDFVDVPTNQLLNRNWRPALSITGIGDMPNLDNAGNVLRPKTSAMLSMRTPPTCEIEKAAAALKNILETDPLYGAKVTVTIAQSAAGWHAPMLDNHLRKLLDEASTLFYGKPAMHRGEGGSIPFMHMLGTQFPQAQFMITGVLGPHSNAHGPNEFLDIEMAKKVTACVAWVIAKSSKM